MPVTDTDLDDLLEVLYRLGCSDISRNVLLHEAKMHLEHWPDNQFWETAEAAEGNKLLILRNRQGYVALTMEGRRRAEARLNPPSQMTTNNLNIGTNINSPIQQAGALANQSQITSYTPQQQETLSRFVSLLEKNIEQLDLIPSELRKAKSQVATIKAQLEDEPDPVIVRQAGRTLRNVIEGAVGSLVAAAIQPSIWSFVISVLSTF